MERQKYLESLPEYGLNYSPVDTVVIGNQQVGKDRPVFIIAEIGSNHRGNIDNALESIKQAAMAGASAVKFQHLTHDKIAADTKVSYKWGNKKDFKTLSEFYKSAELPFSWTSKLIKCAKDNGVMFLSTPFDKEAVDYLDDFNVPAFKVASYEMTDDVLLDFIALKNKPIILSTGMAYLEEVAHAIRVIQQTGNNQIIILHCTSIYPPKNFCDLNLRAITTLKNAFKLPVGFSDHSSPPYLAASLAAVTLGACVIERHFTNDNTGGSNDDSNSLTKEQFKNMVKEIRLTEEVIKNQGIKQPVSYPKHEWDEIYDRWARRSIYTTREIKKGEIINDDMLITLRPWGGIEPKEYKNIIGKKAKKSIKARFPLSWNDLC